MNASFLIADHDLRIAEATRRCLASHGCKASTATNGLQCIRHLRNLDPTVLVLDPAILWGGADGVLEWLTCEKQAMDMMVVVSNGHESPGIPDRLQRWIDLQINRPDSLQDLPRFVNHLETVASWLLMTQRQSKASLHSDHVRRRAGAFQGVLT